MTAKAAFVAIDYPDQGTAGAVCRDMLALYRTNDFVITKDSYTRKDGQERTRLQRFEDIYSILQKHDAHVLYVLDAYKEPVASKGDYLTVQDFEDHLDPAKSLEENAVFVYFNDGTTLKTGIDYGLMIAPRHELGPEQGLAWQHHTAA